MNSLTDGDEFQTIESTEVHRESARGAVDLCVLLGLSLVASSFYYDPKRTRQRIHFYLVNAHKFSAGIAKEQVMALYGCER